MNDKDAVAIFAVVVFCSVGVLCFLFAWLAWTNRGIL